MTYRYGNGLPGGGPWYIDDECSARLHNTLNAALGRMRSNSAACTCPRAASLLSNYNGYRKDMRNTHRANGRQKVARLERVQHTSGLMPDLFGATCTSPLGQEISLAAFEDKRTLGGEVAICKAKEMCEGCPVVQDCRDYVLSAERPYGDWGGVWGGLSVRERRRLKGVDA